MQEKITVIVYLHAIEKYVDDWPHLISEPFKGSLKRMSGFNL